MSTESTLCQLCRKVIDSNDDVIYEYYTHEIVYDKIIRICKKCYTNLLLNKIITFRIPKEEVVMPIVYPMIADHNKNEGCIDMALNTKYIPHKQNVINYMNELIKERQSHWARIIKNNAIEKQYDMAVDNINFMKEDIEKITGMIDMIKNLPDMYPESDHT